MNTDHHMGPKIGDNVTVMLNGEPFTYVEDGRPCEVIALRDLEHGDEILGWYGEPFTFGTVDHVLADVGQGVVRYWQIVMDDGRTSDRLRDPNSPRRIASRDHGQHLKGCPDA